MLPQYSLALQRLTKTYEEIINDEFMDIDSQMIADYIVKAPKRAHKFQMVRLQNPKYIWRQYAIHPSGNPMTPDEVHNIIDQAFIKMINNKIRSKMISFAVTDIKFEGDQAYVKYTYYRPGNLFKPRAKTHIAIIGNQIIKWPM